MKQMKTNKEIPFQFCLAHIFENRRYLLFYSKCKSFLADFRLGAQPNFNAISTVLRQMKVKAWNYFMDAHSSTDDYKLIKLRLERPISKVSEFSCRMGTCSELSSIQSKPSTLIDALCCIVRSVERFHLVLPSAKRFKKRVEFGFFFVYSLFLLFTVQIFCGKNEIILRKNTINLPFLA